MRGIVAEMARVQESGFRWYGLVGFWTLIGMLMKESLLLTLRDELGCPGADVQSVRCRAKLPPLNLRTVNLQRASEKLDVAFVGHFI